MNQKNEHPSRPVVLITGVSRKKGIGFGVAKILAQNGYNLFLQGFPTFDATKHWGIDPGGLKAIGEELKGTGNMELVLERKLANVRRSRARVLLTDNPGCLLHLRGGADAAGLRVEVLHVAEFLAARLPSAREPREHGAASDGHS